MSTILETFDMHAINWVLILNLSLVFCIGAIYSFVELINKFKTLRKFFNNLWGVLYVFINGFLSVIALVANYYDEVSVSFLGSRILLAGTSALALLRVISVPVKSQGVSNQTMSLIQIFMDFVVSNYNSVKYQNDFSDIKRIMKGVDYKKAADALPPLCAVVLNKLSEADGKKMKIEIQQFLKIQQDGDEIKCINLGFIIAKYVGVEVLESTVDNIREYLSVDSTQIVDDLDVLIAKYQK